MSLIINVLIISGIAVLLFILVILFLVAAKLYKLYSSLQKTMPRSVSSPIEMANWSTLWNNLTPVYPYVGSIASLPIYEVSMGAFTKFVRAPSPFNALLISFILESPAEDLPMAEITLYSESGMRLGGYLSPVSVAREWCSKILHGVTSDSEEPYDGTIQ